MSHDIRRSAAPIGVAGVRTARIIRFPGNPRMAKGAYALDADAHRPAVPLSAKDAAGAVLASGLLERIAEDIARLDREIAAKPARISFDEALAMFKGPIVAMKGWGL